MGFALGIERILLAQDAEHAQSVQSSLDVFVIAMKEEYQPQAFLLLQQLRQSGISANMSFSPGSMKSQMGRANKANARFALILGEEEMKNNTVALKDMSTSQQEIVAQENIVSRIKN